MSTGGGPWIHAVGMVAAFALTWGGVKLIGGRVDRRKGWLMIVAAAVLLANVAIMTL